MKPAIASLFALGTTFCLMGTKTRHEVPTFGTRKQAHLAMHAHSLLFDGFFRRYYLGVNPRRCPRAPTELCMERDFFEFERAMVTVVRECFFCSLRGYMMSLC